MVWLLAMAVPLYGTAAVAQSACGPADGHSTAAPHDVDGVHAPRGAHTAAEPALQLGKPGRTAARAAPDAGADAVAVAAHLVKAKCNACSGSGLLAALPSSPPPFGSHAAAGSAVREWTRIAASFLTSGPERPPRTVLA